MTKATITSLFTLPEILACTRAGIDKESIQELLDGGYDKKFILDTAGYVAPEPKEEKSSPEVEETAVPKEENAEIVGKKTSAGKKLNKLATKLASTSTGDIIETGLAIGATTAVNATSGLIRGAIIKGVAVATSAVIPGSEEIIDQAEGYAHKANALLTGTTIGIDAIRVCRNEEARKEIVSDAKAVYSKSKAVLAESYEKVSNLI